MAGKRTFSMIKPDAFGAGNTGNILKMIEEAGFGIVAAKVLHMSEDMAKTFYSVHEGRAFYEPLCHFMSSGPIMALILEKENAVTDFRELIGKTNPEEAAEGTVRSLYATSTRENAVHGSDSDENAELEASFFFNKFERVELTRVEVAN
ncbi:nucleoside-diphosphate kinase [Sediminitomix flava]|uniref:Nucleoside diphosphate kinase n=1 Tax=Sediminitomix flava TaxID=379075 RepID=A0A315ZH65_SEDFL|nr:nucleoside-diphosphate kinase [Sediminitomix flava]PWJ44480.1 nucleoside diphosphate kinase [Sediminitomix flava]